MGIMTAHLVMAGEGRPSTTLLLARRKVVDGRPSPVMMGWRSTAPHLTRFFLGVA